MRRVFENALAFASGAVISVLGIFIHNFFLGWFPLGLIVGLTGSVAASRIIGIKYGRRGVRFWMAAGWILLTLRGATFGNGDELLIMANGAGNTFLGLGFLLMVGSIWTRL